MKDQHIVNIGKYVFGLFFLLGNLFFFGFFITGNTWLVEWWIVIFIFGTGANLLMVLGLLFYGLASRLKMSSCLKAIGFMLLNIPLAFLYIILGIHLTFQ